MLLEKKILALREELEEREAAMQVDSTWWTQKNCCHAFDSRLKDEGTVSLGRCVAIYSETKTEGSGNKSFRHLHLHLHIRELETELLLAAKRASLAYGSTSSASERSASQNSSDLS